MAMSLVAAGVASLALLGAPVSAQDNKNGACGFEGQDPCDNGCQANFMPEKGTIPDSAWYPIGDNYVVAPEAYAKRQTPGKCTRCGNLYEPACKEGEDNNFCWSGMYSQAPLVEGADGLCIPEQQQEGCGTHGKPLCPDHLVDELGTLAILVSPTDGQPWRVMPTLYERNGCLWSDHNPNLRFVPAPKDWLPDGHDCAEVCVHCGHAGEPACDIMPGCARRMSMADPYEPMDGPVYEDDRGFCTQLHCGASTYSGALPACPKGDLNAKIGEGVDTTGDGCADPYKKDAAGECSGQAQADSANPPKLPQLETMCVEPSTRVLTEDLAARLVDAGQVPGVAVGECEQCGRADQLPCNGADFGGCFVNEGFVLNEEKMLCEFSKCGGTGNAQVNDAPFYGPWCELEPVPEYAPDVNPINKNTDCLFFHNLRESGKRDKCVQCGWPGRKCEKECIYAIQWNPVGLPNRNVGTYRLRTDLRSSKHCAPLPKLEMYPGKCPTPEAAEGAQRTNDAGEPMVQGDVPDDAASDAEVGTPVHLDRSGDDVTFGTGDNQDECQFALEDIDRVWTTECPGGGSPVPKYGQCGGTDWDGPTCCFGYAVCVKKNEFYHMCEDANVPAGIIPWHMECAADDPKTVCEIGAECKRRAGASYCEPKSELLVVRPSGGGSCSAAGGVGVAFAVLAIIALLATVGFVCFKRNKGRMPEMPKVPNMPKMDRMWRARDYVATSTSAGKLNDNDNDTMSMEDSAADEFIDMRVPTERAPIISTAARSGALDGGGRGSGALEEANGFGGGFGGGGGSGIGRGGIGRMNKPGLGRNASGRNLGGSGAL